MIIIYYATMVGLLMSACVSWLWGIMLHRSFLHLESSWSASVFDWNLRVIYSSVVAACWTLAAYSWRVCLNCMFKELEGILFHLLP